ncbi:MAG TPA: diacylglycerol kinase family lipid kinase [Saprospiraceae bacterium]|nr:diacylglycerol kinase family lipid kinase [Saprospiraceae bacterium]HNG90496.1 diacylglycerol kinase family lipid kinase [Saprospiraceae bacterium]
MHPYIKNPLVAELLRPRRIAFIVNPMAGTNLQRYIRESVEKHLDAKRFEYDFKFTAHAGHAFELAREAVAEGFDIVAAVGGDGSINEVASGLVGTPVVLGIVPAGSGNGLAMHLGYGRELDEAVQKINDSAEKTIDVGLLNGQPFVNLAGIGFDGLVSNMMKGSTWRGFLPYFLKSVEAGLKYTPKTCRIELDDRVVIEKCFAIAVANGPMYGYNFQIAPDALLDDGLFEVVVLKDTPRWQYFAAVPSMLNGKIYEAEFVEHFASRRVRISAEGQNFVHLDGEGLVIDGDLNFEIQPQALRILVPRRED